MEGFQFIIESPQEAQSHKKRPRLVTSCDNCRLKKIKCLQPSPESECEACKAAKIPCRFRDRERYFAERSRAIAGPGLARPTDRNGCATTYDSISHRRAESAVPPEFPVASANTLLAQSPSSMQRSSSYSPPQSATHDNEIGHVRYQSYPLDHVRGSGSHNGFRSVQPSSSSTFSGYDRQVEQSPQYRSSSVLFDAGHPLTPQRAWMQQFIHLSINNMGAHCPFLSYEEIYDKHRRYSLPPLISNCIAALGARYSNLPDVVARGPLAVAEIYSDTAKGQLSALLQHPSLDALQAAILLAWAEYKSGRGQGFRQYSEIAMQTAMAIGLSEQSSMQLNLYDPYESRLRTTWSSLSQLRLYASSWYVLSSYSHDFLGSTFR